MEIKITLLPIDDQLSGFELGDFSLSHNGVTITSAGRTPSQSMIIFIFMSDFLEMLGAVTKSESESAHKIIAADSSFSLTLTRSGQNLVVEEKNATIVLPLQDFLKTIYLYIYEWLEPLKIRIDTNDPALADLISALNKLKEIF
jgi:hypothetical protein